VTTYTNDTLAAPFDMGAVNGVLKAYSSTTNSVGITADYTNALFRLPAADNSPDSTYQFSVTGASSRRVRITAEDSHSTPCSRSRTRKRDLPTNNLYDNDKESSTPRRSPWMAR